MKHLITQINKVFESRIRLGIMSLLMIHERMDYNEMKDALNISDGNLANHVFGLEKARYLSVKKSFAERKPRTTYSATAAGKKAFKEHLDALEQLINQRKK